MLKPVLTEKSMGMAKEGKYTFLVGKTATKHQIKEMVSKVFGVEVGKVRTIKVQGETKKNYRGAKRVITAKKKAIVTLKGKGKIDLFEADKKGKK